jgi:hypothetical protein
VLLQLQELQKIEKPHPPRDTCVQIVESIPTFTPSAPFSTRDNAASGGNITYNHINIKFIFTSFNVLTTPMPVSRINNYGVNTCVY